MEFDENRTSKILLDRIQDLDDQEAWSEFYQFYWQLIIGWAKLNGCSDTMAQDVFQETIVSLIKNLPFFEYDSEKGRFRSYLKTIVIRRVRDAFRREGKYATEWGKEDTEQGGVFSSFENLPDPGHKNDVDMDKHWVQTVLSQALQRAYAKVDDSTYKSFCMHVLDEMSVDQVASKIGTGRERNIYEHKHRMIEIIKREFITIIENMGGFGVDIDDALLKTSLEELIKGDVDKRTTLEMEDAYLKLFDQITDLKKKLKMVSFSGKGAFLVFPEREPASIKLKSPMTLGREDDNDIILDGDTVSGRHATVLKSERVWTIKDENSRNGIYVNGKMIDRECFLKNGDIIQITSAFQLVFYCKDK